MAAPQGYFSFLGVRGLYEASGTLATGISPSTFTLTVEARSFTPRIGPLVLSYGGKSIVFRDCVVDRAESVIGGDGYEVWRLTILDRRWKWRNTGKISGYYNARLGGEIVAKTKKHARDMVKLCLAAMGERGADYSLVPTTAYPEVSWDYEQPAEALAKLCDQLRMVVVLGTDDRVSIQPINYGPKLPQLPSLESYGTSIDPPEQPDSIVVVGGYTRFNGWWELEAVGLEPNGDIKLIDDLSYKPEAGWTAIDIQRFGEVAEEFRSYAQRSVFRWFRVKVPIKLPGVAEQINDLERVLPIDKEEIKRTSGATGRKFYKLAQVVGVFYNGEDDFGVWYDKEANPDSLINQSVSSDDFDIDSERGIVTFREAKYTLTIGASFVGGQQIRQPKLWLRSGLSYRHKDTLGWERVEFARRLPGASAGTNPKYVVRDDLILEVDEVWAGDKRTVTTNRKDIEREAEVYLDEIQREFEVTAPTNATYHGLVDISPSGAVPSVSWSIDGSGWSQTKASYQVEDYSAPVPPRAIARDDERRRAAREKEQLAERAKAERLRRGRA